MQDMQLFKNSAIQKRTIDPAERCRTQADKAEEVVAEVEVVVVVVVEAVAAEALVMVVVSN